MMMMIVCTTQREWWGTVLDAEGENKNMSNALIAESVIPHLFFKYYE